jgi:hypothetical protein
MNDQEGQAQHVDPRSAGCIESQTEIVNPLAEEKASTLRTVDVAHKARTVGIRSMGVLHERQRESKDHPLTQFAFNPDSTALRFHQALSDRQPETWACPCWTSNALETYLNENMWV